ncbi:hypothetical protein HMPREF9554_01277 [Treponema phagedenis F0421]|nr:hypothetical protein HMPREF9554_01277 [Treponema phagedenis F0421]
MNKGRLPLRSRIIVAAGAELCSLMLRIKGTVSPLNPCTPPLEGCKF